MKPYQFYGSDNDGVVLVGFGPSDSGKSMAAEFLLHGDHDFRPVRGLIFSVAGVVDFAKKFGEQCLGKPSGESTAYVLAEALTRPPERDSPWAASSRVRDIDFDPTKPIKLYGDAFKVADKLPGKFAHTPLLIIADFDTDSEENE